MAKRYVKQGQVQMAAWVVLILALILNMKLSKPFEIKMNLPRLPMEDILSNGIAVLICQWTPLKQNGRLLDMFPYKQTHNETFQRKRQMHLLGSRATVREFR